MLTPIRARKAIVAAEILVLRIFLLIIKELLLPPPSNYGCNCRNRSNCPLDNKCLTPSIVYRAIVSAIHKPDKKYFGISETPFKDRYNNHTRDFRHKEYVNSTELSKYIWKLKDEGETPSITEVFVDYV